MMNFLAKIEDFINQLIIRLCELVLKLFKRMIPSRVLLFYQKLKTNLTYVIKNFKTLPATIKVLLIEIFKKIKNNLLSIDYKNKLTETCEKAKTHYKAQSSKGVSKFKTICIAPLLLMSQWLQGLSAAQSVMLLSFTAASFLAGISIVSTGHRIAGQDKSAARNPASIAEELKYDRPEYYKKEVRHVLVTNLRLPVYIGNVNDLKSVDIDFNITLSNRQSKIFLEKSEFQLRDHLILHIELLIASFPLEEEGSRILKEKMWLEIDNFLKQREIDGHVKELKLTYILAN